MGKTYFGGHRGGLAAIGLLLLFSLLFGVSFANVVLIGNNISLSFDDIEANFVPAIEGSGVYGVLQLAEPPDACTLLTNKAVPGEGAYSLFALSIRGSCTFEDKVRNVQGAGFRAAIIYNNEDSTDLVSMAGNSNGITIYAVFISKAAGEMLLKYIGNPYMELWIIPSFENTAWSVMAISFISLLAICAVLATCFFVRRHRIRHAAGRPWRVREFHGMSGILVRALPSLIFSSAVDDSCTSQTCAICLEDYSVGEKLRVLPCHHKFHALCIDSWLTMWRSFCPVCKRDARLITNTGGPAPSENTPLLSPSSSVSSGSASVQASFAGSRSIHIHARPSYVVSYSGASRQPSSYMTRSQSVGSRFISPDDSNRNTSRQPSLESLEGSGEHNSDTCSLSPHATPQPFGGRYAPPFISGSFSASPQIVNSCSRPPRLASYAGFPSYGVSWSSISPSPFASGQSLPGYQEVTS